MLDAVKSKGAIPIPEAQATPMMEQSVRVVIVNFRTYGLVEACVAALTHSPFTNHE
jgi:hypothetical protein